jgi:DNA-directed RNA polymerase specialized sigma24 family protein
MTRLALQRIEKLTAHISQLTAEQDFAVSQARANGATWAEIADALGCSPQAAHKRYRWVRHSERTREVWHERPLPM